MVRPVALITGSTRGIGQAMAIALARTGYDLVITGKSEQPHPKLPGTLSSVAQEVAACGAQVLPFAIDVRDESKVTELFAAIQQRFGRLDLLVNNASALSLIPTEQLPMKTFDLIHQVGARATFACTQAALPLLKKAPQPRVVNMCPPLQLEPRFLEKNIGYTMSKYSMSLCVLGFAHEFAAQGLAVHGLWPQTLIATAAVQYQLPPHLLKHSRHPSIVADALLALLRLNPEKSNGRFFLDEDLLRQEGVSDFSAYATDPNAPPFPDLYTDDFQW